jgi:trigger factor
MVLEHRRGFQVKATLTEPNSTERVLDIEVPRDRFDRLFDEKLKKYGKEIRLNGFRPGQVPKQVVAAKYGGHIKNETLEALIEEAVKEGCKQHALEPIAPGRVEKIENDEGKPILVQCIIEIDPPFEVANYNLSIPVKAKSIGDAEIDEALAAQQKRMGKETPVERAAAMGDVVACEYLAIQVGGEVQPLPQHPHFRVELGTSRVAQMDQALVGAVAGEEREITVTYPNDFANPAMAGKEVQYHLRIESVATLELPALDDAFAVTLGQENLATMRLFFKERLERQALDEAKGEAYEEAIKQLLASHPVAVPKARIANYVKYKLEEIGHKHEEGVDHGHDHSDLEQEGELNIRRFRILDAIAKKENIKPTQEEVDARIRDLAASYGADFEQLKASLRKNGRILDIREEIKNEKTLDFIIGFKA